MKTDQKKNVEMKVKSVKESYGKLTSSDTEFSDFIKIIHQPWYTTPAEAIFTEGLVESILSLTNALVQLHQVLITGAKAVQEK